MKLHFAKLNPTENMTLLVTDSVPRQQQSAVAAALMAYGSVYAEQVGFLETPALPGAKAHLQMMGGEFCGNATMSLGAFLAYMDELADGQSADYPLEISGADGIVSCHILRNGSAYTGTVEMPLPEGFETIPLLPDLTVPLVRFPGIAHAIVPEDALNGMDVEALARKTCAALQADALGILQINEEATKMRPLVYVRSTDSAVWERGCGSGTAAVGAYRAMMAKQNVHLTIEQPGGTIAVDAAFAGNHIQRITISGSVRIAALGEAFIELPVE